jgi:hypothetical protein
MHQPINTRSIAPINAAKQTPTTIDKDIGLLLADDDDAEDEALGESVAVTTMEENGASEGAITAVPPSPAAVSITRLVAVVVGGASTVVSPSTPAIPVGTGIGSLTSCCRRCRYWGIGWMGISSEKNGEITSAIMRAKNKKDRSKRRNSHGWSN